MNEWNHYGATLHASRFNLEGLISCYDLFTFGNVTCVYKSSYSTHTSFSRLDPQRSSGGHYVFSLFRSQRPRIAVKDFRYLKVPCLYFRWFVTSHIGSTK